MRKSEISEKQTELRTWLKKIALSQNEFAALFYDEHHENCIEEDVERFKEKFKKQLSRQSTKVELLETYLDYLFSTEKFKEAGYFRPQCASGGILDPEAEKLMKKVSKELTNLSEL